MVIREEQHTGEERHIMDLTYEEKCQRVKALLMRRYVDYCQELGRVVPQAEFARACGVRPASMSQWMNAQRLPEGDNLLNLALSYVGPEIYDAVGQQRAIDGDPRLRYIAAAWGSLSDTQREEVIRLLRELSSHQNNTESDNRTD